MTLTLLPNVDGCGASGRSLDFSKLPNIQEARFAVRWAAGGVPWIPAALSTIKPATSPRILEIRLQFVPDTDNVGAAIDDMGNDLRRVADQVSRIKREFKGTVKLIVDLYPAFKALKNTINVRPYFYGLKTLRNLVDSSSFVPCRFLDLRPPKCDIWNPSRWSNRTVLQFVALGRSFMYVAVCLTRMLASGHWLPDNVLQSGPVVRSSSLLPLLLIHIL